MEDLSGLKNQTIVIGSKTLQVCGEGEALLNGNAVIFVVPEHPKSNKKIEDLHIKSQDIKGKKISVECNVYNTGEKCFAPQG